MIEQSLLIELQKVEQSAIIELYELDITKIIGEKTIFRFHDGVNELRKPIAWQGNVYQPYPIKASGFEKSGQGTSNRPSLAIANIGGLITALSQDYEDLLGGIVTRRQVMVKFLDAVNFAEGNDNADPTQEVVSNYIIERLKSLTAESANFELALPCESDGALIPARIIIANTCSWLYRSSECGFTGGAVADEFDNPVTGLTKDKCSRSLTGCKMRFGSNAVLPFGGFPSSSKLS